MHSILAVDDSASMRQMVSFTLKNAGFTVTVSFLIVRFHVPTTSPRMTMTGLSTPPPAFTRLPYLGPRMSLRSRYATVNSSHGGSR